MVKVLENKQFNGIEVYFETKPESTVLELLKANKWRWHNVKKCWYTKATDEARKIVELLNKDVKIEVPLAMEKQTETGVKVGDIFVSSWGYDQTNVDCYQVVEVKGKSTVVLREVSYKYVEGTQGSMSSGVQPVKDAFISDELITKRIKDNYISFDFSLATLWDGKRSYYCSWYA